MSYEIPKQKGVWLNITISSTGSSYKLPTELTDRFLFETGTSATIVAKVRHSITKEIIDLKDFEHYPRHSGGLRITSYRRPPQDLDEVGDEYISPVLGVLIRYLGS